MKSEKRSVGVGGVFISPLAKRYVSQVLKNNRLSHGPFLTAFENEFARLHNRRFAMSVNSGTSALHVAIAALKDIHGWKDGDEVIVPAVTFVATSNVVLHNGLRPVFVDVDPVTSNMDPKKIEAAITKKTRCIMPVHLYGLSAEMEPILKIAKKHNLRVVEDSCESMFVAYKGKPVGSRGDIACFSTYAAHLIVTGVGGLAATNNPEYAVVMKSMMNHGRDSIYLSIDDDDALTKTSDIFKMANRRFSFERTGWSYRLTELEGALGLAELKVHKTNLKKRAEHANFYLKALRPYEKFLSLPSWPKYSEHAFMMFPIFIKKGSPFERKDIITFLEERGIETRYAFPLLSQPHYEKMYGQIEKHYPVAEWIAQNGFYIGSHPYLSKKDLMHVQKSFDLFFKPFVKKSASI